MSWIVLATDTEGRTSGHVEGYEDDARITARRVSELPNNSFCRLYKGELEETYIAGRAKEEYDEVSIL